jgi:adenosine deaminase
VIANRFATLADHPLRAIRAAGIPITINTDDPAMIESDLGEEYRRVSAALDLSASALTDLAAEGADSTFLDAADRAALARELAEHRPADAGA